MGHLINPIGFRLSKKTLRDQYIPLYTSSNIRKSVNNLYEVELYLKQFFKHYIFQRSGFIFSHFNLYETVKDLTLVLFVYAAGLNFSFEVYKCKAFRFFI